MNELTKLWQGNKLKFFLLVIPFGIALVYKMLMDRNVAEAKKDVKKAEREDATFKEEQDKANDGANRAKAEADKIEEKIEELPDDENWQNDL